MLRDCMTLPAGSLARPAPAAYVLAVWAEACCGYRFSSAIAVDTVIKISSQTSHLRVRFFPPKQRLKQQQISNNNNSSSQNPSHNKQQLRHARNIPVAAAAAALPATGCLKMHASRLHTRAEPISLALRGRTCASSSC